ncbi:hypothetical protein CPB84DRAFT_863927 [Gymnopilus junonius]|uniref:Uncharacterized protein n=1 Tax=Gymnopilus junonius TaxID=109634 RepID=A0A9P5NRV6_GYMJU|nr:hypothetical protein CPB84DRAFT_863927 [Gymnopilus junonius]
MQVLIRVPLPACSLPISVQQQRRTTVVADPVNTSGATSMSAGSIVGIVVGVLLGLGLVAFCVLYLIRRVRRSRYARRHESDFGTFNRSAFVREKEPSIVPDMTERSSHNVAPSLSGEAMTAAVGAATPPSQALAAANAASATAGAAAAAAAAALQERPKYVFGQPVQNEHGNATEDNASETAGGVYSSQPVMQTDYNPEAYGSYAKYEDVAHTGGYQDAQREYQGQQGYYDQNQYDQGYNQGYMDQQGYVVGGYDQQQHQAYVVQDGQYDYSAQHAQYAAAGAYDTQHQGAYQQPHPYANNSAVGGGNDAAYGGM